MTLSPAFVTAFANMAVRRLPHSHVFIHRPGIRWHRGFESWVGRCGRVNPPPPPWRGAAVKTEETPMCIVR
jgi:hypothetical protein